MQQSMLRKIEWRRMFVVLFTIFTASLHQPSSYATSDASSQEEKASHVSPLSLGAKSRRSLKMAEYDVYHIDLQPDFFIRIVAEQRGVDLKLRLIAPQGNILVDDIDSPTGAAGAEGLSYVSEAAGRYRIEVHALEYQGEYEIELTELRKAGNRERTRALANSLHRKAYNDVMSSNPSPELEVVLEKKAITLLEQLPLPYPIELADSSFHLGQLYRETGELKKAKRSLQQALNVREQSIGKESLEVAQVLDEMALVLQGEGVLDEAEQIFRKELEIRIKADPGGVDTALSKMNIANLHRDRGDYKAAHPLYQQSLNALESQLKQDDPDLTLVLVPFGEFYRIVAEYDIAERYFKRSLFLYEKRFGSEHQNVVLLLGKMVALYIQTGNFKAADDCISRMQQLQKKIERNLPIDNLDVVTIHSNLGRLYFDRGQYAEAEHEYQRVLSIRQEKLGAKHALVALSLNNLAGLYSEQDLFIKADEYYQKALEIYRTLDDGTPRPGMADVLSNVGSLYMKKGDYKEAERFYRDALQIRERVFTPSHPAVAASLNQIATALTSKAENARRDQRDAANIVEAQQYLKAVQINETEAEKFLLRALQIQETKLHPENPAITATLYKLGLLHARQRSYLKAEQAYQRALKINRQAFGPGHPYSARILNEIANLYRDQQRNEQAAAAYEQSLDIQSKQRGINSQFLIQLLSDYALFCRHTAQPDKAEDLLERSLDLIESSINRNLGVGSERQKLTYLATFKNVLDQIIELDEGQDMVMRHGRNLAFLALLRLKGRGLDEMVDRLAVLRARAIQGEQEPLDRLRAACAALSALTWREPDPSDPAAHRKLLETQAILEAERDKAESEVNRINPDYDPQPRAVTLAEVRDRLTEGAGDKALIEFVVYNKRISLSGDMTIKRYAAYVFTPNEELRRVDLGNAEVIEKLVDDLRTMLRNKNVPETAVRQKARQLDRHIMQPVRASLEAMTRHLIVSPDGAINLIPIASLVDEQNEYLVERYLITYLTSGRDLLRLKHQRQTANPPLLVSNPAFDGVPDSGQLLRKGTLRSATRATACDLSQIPPFAQLPEAAREVESIGRLLPQAKLLSFDKATSEALREIQSPNILHIATHGFFLCKGRIKNPLLRSGLAMAGFNQRKSHGGSGVLMAMDVAALNLEGTQLAVLSACETGLGDVQNGEGVHGLRRALVLAGSATQVISLWEVSTYYTRFLMTNYYTGMLGEEKQGRGEALRQVQLKMLNKRSLRHPFYWAAFIQSGAWGDLE